MSELTYYDPSDFLPAPNVRGEVDEQSSAFKEMLESVQIHGVFTPAMFYTENGKKMLWDGFKRQRAAILTGKSLPAIEQKPPENDQERIIVQLIVNSVREDVSPLAKAIAMATLYNGGMSIETIASTISRSSSYVSNHLSLLDLIEPLQQAVASGQLTADAAVEASRLDRIEQEKYQAQIIAAKTGRAVKRLRQVIKAIAKVSKPTQSTIDLSIEPENPELIRFVAMIRVAQDMLLAAIEQAVQIGVDITEYVKQLKEML
jgi:ParB/RepB/Spo0J family partition protein